MVPGIRVRVTGEPTRLSYREETEIDEKPQAKSWFMRHSALVLKGSAAGRLQPATQRHHLRSRGPSAAPMPAVAAMPVTYQMAMNGNAVSGQ